MFSILLVIGYRGADTDAGRVVVVLFTGGIALVSVAGWIWFLKDPSQLLVTRDTITLAHQGRGSSVVLRNTGDLYIHQVRIGSKAVAQSYLKARGAEEAIPLQMFAWRRVREACLATGWRIETR